MAPETLAVAALATWRLAALLYFDAGPWGIFERLRLRAGAYLPVAERPFWGKQLGCFWCCAGIAALPCALLALLPGAWWGLLLPFALSGAAALLSGGGRIVWREMVEE